MKKTIKKIKKLQQKIATYFQNHVINELALWPVDAVEDFQKSCVCDADLSEIEFIEGSLAGKRWLDFHKRWIDLVERLTGLGGRLIR